jgi:hypothetical protein
MKKLLLLLAFSIIIQGCMASMPQPSRGPVSDKGQFSETQFDENIFKVSYKNNGQVPFEKAADLTLRRCAELTLEKGYKYFVIIDADSYAANSEMSADGQEYSAAEPSSTNIIVCFEENPNLDFSYNANSIRKKDIRKHWRKY